MAKLGYTFYPKDWGNSESVFELNLSERGLYREFIDLAMLNNNEIDYKPKIWSRKFGTDIKEIENILNKLILLKLIELKNDILSVPSCEQRLVFVRAGRKGGEKSVKPISKPIDKPIDKPKGNQRERERERESKIYKKDEQIKVDYFLGLFNEVKSDLKKIKSNHRILNPTDTNNLLKLIKAGYKSEDFINGMLAMDESEWVTENNMFTPSHFLRNENFEKYVNTKIRKNLKVIGKPETFES